MGTLAADARLRLNLPKARIIGNPLRPLSANVLESALLVNSNYGLPQYHVASLPSA